MSTGSTQYAINLNNCPTSSPFSVSSGGSLSLMNVAVNGALYGASPNYTAMSPFSIGMGGHLFLGAGTTVSNFYLSDASGDLGGMGGAINIMGGSVDMYGAVILNCSAASGGAVYLGDGSNNASNLKMGNGSTISGCSAVSGGGVYVSEGGLSLDGSAILPSITGNTATTDGGGVYLGSGYVYDPFECNASVITGNICSGAGAANIGGTTANIDSLVHTMFVTAAGTGTGRTLADPASFAAALATATVNTIILTADIPLAAGIAVNRQLNIWSVDGGSFSIYPSQAISGPMVTIASTYQLNMSNVLLGPRDGDTSTASTLVRVEYNGILNLNEGAALRNNVSSGAGSAVYLAGGALQMYGGSIQNCSTSSTTGGGGVYVTTGSDGTTVFNGSVMLNNGSITGCTAVFGAGGGVHQGAGFFYVNGGTISGCSAMAGGGVYVASGATLNLEGTTFAIKSNAASTPLYGGGAYIATGGMYSDMYSSALTCITGNTAGGAAEAAGVTVQ